MSYLPTKEDEENLAKTLRHLREDWRGFKLVDVGSTAKGTWLRGDSDIDLYVICEDKEERDKMYFHASKILYPSGHAKEGQLLIWSFRLNGFDIDLVLIEKAFTKREDTTQHAKYYNQRLSDEQRTEVRKAKAYFKTKGVYGAEIGGIVGVAIEQLLILFGDFERVCKYLILGRPKIQDPTMKTSRDLLASINNRRWGELQKACRNYLLNPNFEYKVMTTMDFIEQHPRHCTIMFRRLRDKALDCQVAQGTAKRMGRILRNTEPDVRVDSDTYVDSQRIVICYRVTPPELSELQEVCVDPKLAGMDAFNKAHPIAYKKGQLVCTWIKRKVRFPDIYFYWEVIRLMQEKGYKLL